MKDLPKITIATLCILLFGCNQQPSTKKSIPDDSKNQTEHLAKDNSPVYQNIIPDKLLEFVRNQLPEMQVPTTGDYIEGWESFIVGINLPYYCSGDYNGDGLKDHCLLLMKDSAQFFLYAFLTADESYKTILIDKIGRMTKEIEIVLSTEPRGEWESIEETVSVAFDGITLNLVEESNAWSYYWKNDRFVQFYYD